MKNIYRILFILSIFLILFVPYNNNGDDIIIFNTGIGLNIKLALLSLSIFFSIGFFVEVIKEFFKK